MSLWRGIGDTIASWVFRGEHFPLVGNLPDLRQGENYSVTVTLAAQPTSIEVPDWAQFVILYTDSAGVRMSLNEAPSAESSKTGTEIKLSDLSLGGNIPASQQWVRIMEIDVKRKLYLFGTAGDVVTVEFC